MKEDKVIEVGNWYTEYECSKCRKRYLTAPDKSTEENRHVCVKHTDEKDLA